VLKDQERQNKLESLGIIFLRFTDYEVKKNVDNVIEVIEATIIEIEGMVDKGT